VTHRLTIKFLTKYVNNMLCFTASNFFFFGKHEGDILEVFFWVCTCGPRLMLTAHNYLFSPSIIILHDISCLQVHNYTLFIYASFTFTALLNMQSFSVNVYSFLFFSSKLISGVCHVSNYR